MNLIFFAPPKRLHKNNENHVLAWTGMESVIIQPDFWEVWQKYPISAQICHLYPKMAQLALLLL